MQLTSRESLMPRAATTNRRSTHSGPRLGERVRQLRVAAGLTQTDLAGERFSKEYVSQIERGKTRPTRETIEWIAARLGGDAGLPANGGPPGERGRARGSRQRSGSTRASSPTASPRTSGAAWIRAWRASTRSSRLIGTTKLS